MSFIPENQRYSRNPIRRQAVVTGMRAVSAAAVGTRKLREAQFAVAAAREALADAGLTVEDLRGRRVAVIIGSAVSTIEKVEERALQIERVGPGRVSPVAVAGDNLQAAPVAVAEMLKIEDANAMGFTNNCSSGVDAIGLGVDLIRIGRYDLVVAGGAEAPLSLGIMTVLSAAGMCTWARSPEEASRPVDRNRECGVIGEGW